MSTFPPSYDGYNLLQANRVFSLPLKLSEHLGSNTITFVFSLKGTTTRKHAFMFMFWCFVLLLLWFFLFFIFSLHSTYSNCDRHAFHFLWSTGTLFMSERGNQSILNGMF